MEWNSTVFKIRKPVLVQMQRRLELGISWKCLKMTLSTSQGHSVLLYTMSVSCFFVVVVVLSTCCCCLKQIASDRFCFIWLFPFPLRFPHLKL